MLALRLEITEQLKQAVTRAERQGLWPSGLQPASYALLDTPRSISGNVSWPGLRTLTANQTEREALAEILLSMLKENAASRFCCSGCTAGFINFSWTEAGREYILRRAAASDNKEEPAALPQDLSRAIQRTRWLEKMAQDQLADNYLSPSGESWANNLTMPEEIRLIHGIERLAWAAVREERKTKQPSALSKAKLLALEWGEYYTRHTLLKGTAEQLRARAALGRALRTVLSSLSPTCHFTESSNSHLKA